MSNMTLFKGGLPTFLSGELDETTKALMGSGGSNAKRISIKGGVFRMMVGNEEVAINEDRAMNIIIVRAAPAVSRTYYEGTYKDGEITTPVCWSADGKAPDPKCETPMSQSCDTCEMNIKGSGEGESKACRYSRKLAVVLDGDVGGDVFQLSLPATSIFGKAESQDKMPLEAYVRFLASHNAPVTAVVTEMRFDTKSPVPKLFFSAVRGLTEEEWEVCRQKADTTDAFDAIQHTFNPAKERPALEVPKPAAGKGASGFKPAKKAQEPETADDDTPPPSKVTKKQPAAAPAQADLKDVISQWAD